MAGDSAGSSAGFYTRDAHSLQWPHLVSTSGLTNRGMLRAGHRTRHTTGSTSARLDQLDWTRGRFFVFAIGVGDCFVHHTPHVIVNIIHYSFCFNVVAQV